MESATTKAPDTVVESGDLGGKFLTFCLDQEEFGIEILAVREIIGLMPVTTVPQAPHYVRGVINLRGQVIPVVDLRQKFAMDAIDDTEETCIIVIQTAGSMLGMVVDKVSEVTDIPHGDIVPAPSLDSEINTDSLLGIGKRADRVTLLLDINVLFGSEAMENWSAAA